MGHEVSNLDELRKRITELANAFLPDGLNPFVDVFDRVRARREMGELINEATTAWHRQTPGQFIEMLFHNDGRLDLPPEAVPGIMLVLPRVRRQA